MKRLSITLRSRWLFEGAPCEVVSRYLHVLTLKQLSDGSVFETTVEHFVVSPGLRPLEDTENAADALPVSTLLDCVPGEELERARERQAHLLEAMTGYRSGNPDVRRPGEPRPAYDPALVPRQKDRFAAKVIELGRLGILPKGSSIRTLHGWKQRWRDHGGLYGLVDRRALRVTDKVAAADPRYVEILREVIDGHVERSNVSAEAMRQEALRAVRERYGEDSVRVPGRSSYYVLFEQLTTHRHTLGEAALRRDVARRRAPQSVQLKATRSGEIVQIDSTKADVLCLDRATGKLCRPEITLAVDCFDKRVCAVRVIAEGTKGVDASLLLYDIVTPEPMQAYWPERALWPYQGVPKQILLGAMKDAGWTVQPANLGVMRPETVVIDHGRVFVSRLFLSGAQQLVINVQPAPPGTPNYKGIVERFFKSLNNGLLHHLPGHTGRSVGTRGKDVEREAWLFLDELRDLLVMWIASVYHYDTHEGCRLMTAPQIAVSPNEMFLESVARAGYVLDIPTPESRLELLPIDWKLIQPYGINHKRLTYYDEILEKWRTRVGPYPGRKDNKHPFRYDPRDLSVIWFQDPDDGAWYALRRTGTRYQDVPFGEAAVGWTKRLMLEEGRDTNNSAEVSLALDEVLARQAAGRALNSTEQRVFRKMVRDGWAAAQDDHQALLLPPLPTEVTGAQPSPRPERPVADWELDHVPPSDDAQERIVEEDETTDIDLLEEWD